MPPGGYATAAARPDQRNGRHAGSSATVRAFRPGARGRWAAPLIRVLVAEDVPVVRETLAGLLNLEDDIEVAAALSAGDQIVPAALRHRPDVTLLGIGLPGMDGLTAVAELARRLPGCRALILTGPDSPGNLRAALRAGATGFLLKNGPAGELIDAVRAVARGERVIDARLADQAPGSGEPTGQA